MGIAPAEVTTSDGRHDVDVSARLALPASDW